MMERRSFADDPLQPRDSAVLNGADGRASALAHHQDFRLGEALVQPSIRTVAGPGGSVTVEPRVMQLLVALARADGAVLTRDALMAECWNGQVVGDDALTRAVAALRRAAREADAGFGLETIPRIGYRLTERPRPLVDDPPPEPVHEAEPTEALRSAPINRRGLLASGAVAATAAAAGGWALLRPPRDPRAEALVLRGEQAVRDEFPDGAEQGVGFLREAVAIDPDSPRAWGLLAMAWRNVAENAPPAAVTPAVRACESAAARALQLDARQANALTAMATIQPIYGDWLAAEQRLDRVLAASPDHAPAIAAKGVLLQSVGRTRASTALAVQAAQLEPLSPIHQYRLAYKHMIAGQVAAADQVIDRAVQLWPRHPAVLIARMLIFIWTDRYRSAQAIIDDEMQRRAMMPARGAVLWRSWLRALETRAPTDLASARTGMLAAAAGNASFSIYGIQLFTIAGMLDEAFACADGYLLRRGSLAGSLQIGDGQMPVNDQRWRKTLMLFLPVTAPLRADPRFAKLCQEIGLAEYYRRRGIGPDYLSRDT